MIRAMGTITAKPETAVPNRRPALLLGALATAVSLLLLFLLWHGRFQATTTYPAANATYVATDATILLRFSDPLPADLPTDAITLSPRVTGHMTTNGHWLTFHPDGPLQPNTTYALTIQRGLTAANGRSLWLPQSTQFTTGPTQVAYLSPAAGGDQLFVQPLDGQPRQLTHHDGSVGLYDLSPDGSRIAYGVANAVGTTGTTGRDLWLTSLDGTTPPTQLLACAPDQCRYPLWHPDGYRILYERIAADSSQPTLWWLDTTSGETIPALANTVASAATSAPSQSAQFSPDGTWLTYVAGPEEGLWLYNFATGEAQNLPNDTGTPAVWSPDGRSLLFRNHQVAVAHGQDNTDHQEHSHDYSLSVYLFRQTLGQPLQPLSAGFDIDDAFPAWSPDGSTIAFTRKKPRVFMGRQLWLMAADGSNPRPLTTDFDYNYGPPSWSANGRFLLYQRANLTDPTQPPAIWQYDTQNDTQTQLIPNAHLPRWIN